MRKPHGRGRSKRLQNRQMSVYLMSIEAHGRPPKVRRRRVEQGRPRGSPGCRSCLLLRSPIRFAPRSSVFAATVAPCASFRPSTTASSATSAWFARGSRKPLAACIESPTLGFHRTGRPSGRPFALLGPRFAAPDAPHAHTAGAVFDARAASRRLERRRSPTFARKSRPKSSARRRNLIAMVAESLRIRA